MESPQLYDSSDYHKKTMPGVIKVKNGNHVYPNDEYADLAELSAPEISLDLHGLIDDSHFNDNFIQGIEGLSVEKNSNAPRGLGVNNNNNNMYNTLPYIPTPVHHGATQYDRPYQDRDRSIKEEPQENHLDVAHHEYPSCRVGNGGAAAAAAAVAAGYGAPTAYHGAISAYSMTPTTVPGAESLCRSPLKSPGSMSMCMSPGKMMPGCKKNADKGSDEYKRRRERNNIAVRKSREKAKARSRETEERVKKLMVDNDRLAKKCDLLSKEVAVFHSMFANVHCLPEHVQRELRKQMEAFNQQHQHLLNM